MKLLNIYESKEEAESAENKISGEKRLVSDREDNKVIYKLLGQPTWGNFYRLGMFNLTELEAIVANRSAGRPYDQIRYKEIISMLNYAAKQFEIEIPPHWL